MYQSFIGLEIHIHLLTKTKAFCGCTSEFGAPPNTHICPVCLGYPGVLPAANEEAMRMSYMVAKILHCTLSPKCYFDRKNYFYPDMTKNYQISQFHDPVGRDGYFDIEVEGEHKRVRIHDVHLEEDAGKMIHSGKTSLCDYNRAGTSLLEIVTEPDLVTGKDAEAFIREFRRMVRHLGVCDGNMEEGSLRCDANVSINLQGQGLGTKTEVKNLNSARFVRKALEYEIKRQKRVLTKGEKVIQETRLWDGDNNVTAGMRTKEKAHDYRYFPEPDMPPFCPDDAFMAAVDERMVELPLAKKQRYLNDLKLSLDAAEFLVEDSKFCDLFEAALALESSEPKLVANWLCGDVQGQLKRADVSLEESHISAGRLNELVGLVESGKLLRGKAKEVIELIINDDKDPAVIVKEQGFEQVLDESQIDDWVKQAIDGNPQAVEQIQAGNKKTLSFLVGQVMRFSKGKADPKKATEKLEQALGL
ncbi:MAG: Asp-tRNA(Asn)/Glu-tRNA(Gln) amidotransferase subunit GatB [Deltaproteobacteria bacterium]|nr:Asp-tRNA(Asn)/Glu-tRNA(Gln) amidotransferase subunit GatB [Deltaproteobacteria bacterium]MBN2671039.1 Asp-tRNA(Asn)/Glu-tRNA(Gln) amidotransferase subunit GatB [Deltaproteobacteria bacterium]